MQIIYNALLDLGSHNIHLTNQGREYLPLKYAGNVFYKLACPGLDFVNSPSVLGYDIGIEKQPILIADFFATVFRLSIFLFVESPSSHFTMESPIAGLIPEGSRICQGVGVWMTIVAARV